MFRRCASQLEKKVIPIMAVKPFKLHTAGYDNMPELRQEVEMDKDTLLSFYKEMLRIRRTEYLSDQAYKSKKIRGFCHLYIGQEAIPIGMESILTYQDSVVTAYRDHGWYITRGGSPYEVFCEQMSKQDGCSKGKGGSMHMYLAKNNFFGGNGIVGAQVPIGAGLAWKYAYANGAQDPKNVAVTLYGDGAANQGQIFEAYNISALQKIPCIFVCENNQFAMGTAKKRGSANPEMYRRCEYIPGIYVDGMNIFAVQEATRYAKAWCLAGNGPMLIEMDSYRYMGHSMSDPDSTYRSATDIASVQGERDCIMMLSRRIVKDGFASDEELKKIEKAVKSEIDEAYRKALKAPGTEMEELYTDILAKGDKFPIRTCQSSVFH